MKRYAVLVVLFVFIIALFIAAPRTVLACGPANSTEKPEWTAASQSVTLKVVRMEELPKAPRSWLQIMTDGVQIDKPTKICNVFERGKYGWTGIIYKLVDGSWVKLTTTVDNGACAMATTAGTYALFGYYSE